MTETASGRPEFGIDRPTILFVIWVFVGLSITGLAIVDVFNEGFREAWVFLLSGVLLLWFILRDWFYRGGGEFVTKKENTAFIGMTVFVVAVMLWALLGEFAL